MTKRHTMRKLTPRIAHWDDRTVFSGLDQKVGNATGRGTDLVIKLVITK